MVDTIYYFNIIATVAFFIAGFSGIYAYISKTNNKGWFTGVLFIIAGLLFLINL